MRENKNTEHDDKLNAFCKLKEFRKLFPCIPRLGGKNRRHTKHINFFFQWLWSLKKCSLFEINFLYFGKIKIKRLAKLSLN